MSAAGPGLGRHRLDEFATFPDRLRAAIEGAAATAGSADREGAFPGSWGAAEVVRHLLAVDREVHQPRLRQLATEEAPRWRYAEPELGDTEDAPLPALLDDFAAARATTIAMIEALDGAARGRVATHETFGPLDVDGLIGIAADHDAEHLRDLAAD